MMENRYDDFYSGSTDKKLKNVLDVVIYTLSPYGEFHNLVSSCAKITSDLTWDGIQSIDIPDLVSFLELSVRRLVNLEGSIGLADYRKIQSIIEPTELIITELKMAYQE